MVKKGLISKSEYNAIFKKVTRGQSSMDVFGFVKALESITTKLNNGNFDFNFYHNIVIYLIE